MQIRKLSFIEKNNFWTLQFSGWLLYAILYFLYNQIDPVKITINHIIAFTMVVLIGFTITILLRQIYKVIYSKSKSIFLFSLVTVFCSIVGGFIWMSGNDLVKLSLRLGNGQSVWAMRDDLRLFIDHLVSNTIILSSTIFVWSFIYFSYKLIHDLIVEKGKYQETLLLEKEAQLHMLRYQINPHFLFNSLNSIQALMYINTPLADEMLAEFSEFLRSTLKNKDEIFVPLEDEIEMISKYLYIEKIRFQNELSYEIDVSDNTKKIKILSFLLQPFVENAIKHGFCCKQDILKINIRSSKLDNCLVIIIENSGKWVDNDAKPGLGIKNVKDRLDNAYPEAYRLDVKEENNWVKIKLQLPILND